MEGPQFKSSTHCLLNYLKEIKSDYAYAFLKKKKLAF